MKQVLGILGGGRYGRLVAELALLTGNFESVRFFDDSLPVDGERIVGRTEEVLAWQRSGRISHAAVAIGYKHFARREELFDLLQPHMPLPALIHPRAVVSPSARLGDGVQLFALACVETEATLGNNVTVFNQSTIAHDARIDAHTFLSIGVAMGGGIHIGKRTFVGVNAALVNDISVGDDCVVCGGTFLTDSIGPETTVIGNPWRTITGTEL